MTLEQIAAEVFKECGVESRTPTDAEHQAIATFLCQSLELESRADFGSYGSGYASFVDLWLYRKDESFRKNPDAEHYAGLCVLLSRMAPCYCLLEDEKTWSGRSGTSHLPAFESVDRFPTAAVEQLSAEVGRALDTKRYVRLRRDALEAELPRKVEIPTILSDPPFRRFDAIFHWED